MASSKQLDIRFEDPNPRKWCHPLKEDVFAALMSQENSTVQKILGAGSFFDPLLFGKFFDPSDAFPLWEFEADSLMLSNPHSSNKNNVDWFQTDSDYVLITQLHGIDNSNSIEVCVENGKVIEISGQYWRQPRDQPSEWKSSQWWDHGYVRRLELPEKTDWKKVEARLMNNDTFLEIRVPKLLPNLDYSPKEN
ncbi:21.7 kDa class VI heat shock protein [Dorcoceras hygrometricum]|uniref:21.7 kDa class VI heat shock protein n=1 Tax=Dorcoceras hygrometricum TaxID=472368 RepID=A0A2Z7AU15_9LAMI|nr:21.7 kDa class VI heat shock protein [Dorcoceras hygrometricum]